MQWINQYRTLLALANIPKGTKRKLVKTLDGITANGVYVGAIYDAQIVLLQGILKELQTLDPSLRPLSVNLPRLMATEPSPDVTALRAQIHNKLKWRAMQAKVGVLGNDKRADLTALDDALAVMAKSRKNMYPGKVISGWPKGRPHQRKGETPFDFLKRCKAYKQFRGGKC